MGLSENSKKQHSRQQQKAASSSSKPGRSRKEKQQQDLTKPRVVDGDSRLTHTLGSYLCGAGVMSTRQFSKIRWWDEQRKLKAFGKFFREDEDGIQTGHEAKTAASDSGEKK